MSIEQEIERVSATAERLFSEREVEAAIAAMAVKIERELAGSDPLVLCVLLGGVIPVGRLLPRLQFNLTLDSVYASRYRDGLSGERVEWLQRPRRSVRGRTVLLVDDVLDEGLTLQAICDECRAQGARAVYSAVVVNKRLERPKPLRTDFFALEADDRYLFGYGMDYKGYLRNAAGIYACSGGESDRRDGR